MIDASNIKANLKRFVCMLLISSILFCNGCTAINPVGINPLYTLTAALVIIPWFFMDLEESEKTEVNTLQQRKDALIVIVAEKD